MAVRLLNALPSMKKLFLPLLCCTFAAGQTTGTTTGSIVQPSGDSTLTDIVVGSAVTPGGTFGYTAEVYLVKSDGSAPPRRLTNFDESNQAPGATWVAISPDGTRAAYVGQIDTNGARHEEVHMIDIASGTDQLIAQYPYPGTCGVPSCTGPVTFSQGGTTVLWNSSMMNGTVNGTVYTIYTANFDGRGVTQLGFQLASISGPNNVTTSNGRFVFTSGCGEFCSQAATANLDGSGVSIIGTESNTINENFGDFVIGASGGVIADLAGGYSPDHMTLITTVSVNPGSCTFPRQDNASATSLTISSDGSRVAGVFNGRIFSCEIAVTPPNELYAFDVQLSADGTRMIYSVGANSSRRAAVWISDATGSNARPVFAPRSIYSSGIIGLGRSATDILPLSPGSYFTVYGANFIDQDALITGALPFPASLGGVSVQVNGTPIPVQAVTPFQINALLPQEIAPGNLTVTVQLPDGTQLSQTATAAPSAPAVDLVLQQSDYDPAVGADYYQAAAFHPGTTILADASNPATAGEILETYGFGLGITSPSVAAGAGSPSNPPATAAMPFVNFDGVLAQTTFAGLTPGLAGLYQVNVIVPAGLPPGLHLMHWYAATGASGPEGVVFTH